MAAKLEVQIKGLIRFSYLTEGGFEMSRKGEAAARAALFDPARLERRFRIFEALTLPSLDRQRDKDFTVALLTSADLPQPFLDRLHDMAATRPWLHVQPRPVESHFPATLQAFEDLPTHDGATHIAGFRLDDDDAIHHAMIGRLRRIINRLMPMRNRHLPLGVGFNRGFYMDLSHPEKPIWEVRERTPLGIGLTLVTPLGRKDNIFARNHRRLPEFYDCYTEIAQPMYIRTVHADNDSGAGEMGHRGPMDEAEIDAYLQEAFGGDLAGLRAALS